MNEPITMFISLNMSIFLSMGEQGICQLEQVLFLYEEDKRTCLCAMSVG